MTSPWTVVSSGTRRHYRDRMSSPDPGARRRRDRHGRGLREPLARPPVPLARTRRELFEDVVGGAFDDVAEAAADLGHELRVVVVVTDVPPPGRLDHVGDMPVVPLGDLNQVEDAGEEWPEIVVYRRPIEARAYDDEELADLVHDVVVELAAEALGVSVADLDGERDDEDDE
jgi:predicted Zn-dependent protease with MMP-like domain